MIFKNKIFFGWYVTAACFLISVMGIGTRYTFGVFLKPLELGFGMSRSASSGFFSIYMLFCCLITPLAGLALDRFGPKILGLLTAALIGLGFIFSSRVTSPWPLLLTYSLFLSLGTAPIYTVANSTSLRWFKQKKGLVVGITSSGGGTGAVILAPLAAFFIARYDWRAAFIAMGAIIWVVMSVASLWLVKDPSIRGLSPDGVQHGSDINPDNAAPSSPTAGSNDYTLRQAIRLKAFWLLLLTWISISLALHMVMVHVVPYALSLGIDPLDAACILSLIGFSNLPGRLLIGRISDRFGCNALGTVCMLFLFSALLWLMQARTIWMLYAFALIFGFFWGGAGTMTTVLIGDIFGMRNLGSIMGIMSTAWSIGAAIGPAIAAIIFDLSGHYLVAFGVGAATLFVAVFSIYFTRGPSLEKQTIIPERG